MLQDSVKNIFAVAELRKRVLFTLGMLAVYRVGSHVTIPGINKEALAILAEQARNTMFGLYDMFSGQNLSQMTIFALGIMPYISASIILQLLTVVWPYLERLSKEGELGRRKITQYTRYGTIVLAFVQALGIALFLERSTEIAGGIPLVYEPGWSFRFMTVLTLCTGLGSGDVAGRADHRARHRQRHVADHLRGDRRRPAGGGDHHPRSAAHRPDGAVPDPAAARADGGGHRRHRVRRARPPAGDGAVRQAGRRPADVRRVEHAHPAQGEHRRRHPGDLRVVDSGVSGDAGADDGADQSGAAGAGCDRAWARCSTT